ncbi:MAG: ROK family glucokinase [Clostridia bacterium]|nr:ROK family glucokinase [Clostridia bacterium]
MYYIGIDLGGTKVAVGIVNEEGMIVHKDSVPTKRERDYAEIIADIGELILKVVKGSGIDASKIASIGLGAPGTPNNKDGTLIYCSNLKYRNAPVRADLQRYLNLPVYIENDANCAALAECVAGAAKGTQHSITITLGTGVGGGVIINGRIYSGFNNAAAELGHMVIVSDGEFCGCGRRGCWEAYASATALIRQTQFAAKKYPDSLVNNLVNGDMTRIDAKTAFDAAKQGDEIGLKVVRDYIKYLAEGLTDVINAFQPEVVVIGGGVCKEGEYLLGPLREIIARDVYCKDVPQTQIKVAQMGNDAGIVGAAMLGRNL